MKLLNFWRVFLIPTVAFLGVGMWWTFFNTPPDYQQGYLVRVMFVHVPSAWMAFWIYFMSGLLSLAYLITRKKMLNLMVFASMPIGLTFSIICMVTGSLWGKPMWGTWWVWDARLTSMFILFLSYVAYIILWEAWDGNRKRDLICAFFAILAAVNLPVVKFSVEWWYTLHQPSGFFTESKVHDVFRMGLVWFLLCFISLSATIFIMRLNYLVNRAKKIKRLVSQ